MRLVTILCLFVLCSLIGYSQQGGESSCLVAHYPFDGNADDVSGNNFHGTTMGGVTLTTDRFGNPNSAYEFDGSDDHILCGNVMDPSIQTGMTFSAWFNPYNINSNNENGGINIGRKDIGRASLRPKSDSQKYFQNTLVDAGASNATYGKSDNQFLYNTWYHVVGTYEDNNLVIYVNGVQQTTQGSTGQVFLSDIPSNAELYIGLTYDANDAERYYHGKLDDVRIYDCVLSQQEITDLYNSQSEGCLVAHYPFDGNADDVSGNSFHGTTMGGVTLTTDRFGNPNSAYEFDGVDDHILCGNVMDPSIQSGMTFSAWFRPSTISSGNENGGINIGKKDIGRASLRPKSDSQKYFQNTLVDAGASNVTYGKSDNQFVYNTWYHVVGTFEDNNLVIYVDAVQQTTQGGSGQVYLSDIPSNAELFIGLTYDSNNAEKYYHGKLDDVRIYDCVLSQQEINDLYNSGVSADASEIKRSNLKLYPNPTSGSVTIEYNPASNNTSKFQVLNAVGQIIEEGAVLNTRTSIDLSDVANGVYFVQIIESDEVKYSEKLVVNK